MPRPPLPRQSVTQPLDPSYRLIPLTKGKIAVVDFADYEWLSKWNWSTRITKSNKFYAVRRPSIYMHREIAACSANQEIDHRDGDTLNNRRSFKFSYWERLTVHVVCLLVPSAINVKETPSPLGNVVVALWVPAAPPLDFVLLHVIGPVSKDVPALLVAASVDVPALSVKQ